MPSRICKSYVTIANFDVKMRCCATICLIGLHNDVMVSTSTQIIYIFFFSCKLRHYFVIDQRYKGLLLSALASGSSGPDSNPGLEHCVMVLGKTLDSHIASLLLL